MHFHIRIGLLLAATVLYSCVLPVEFKFFKAGAGSLLCRGRWTLLRDKSGDFAHGGFSSLERIQKVGWIIVEEILSLEGDYPCNGDPLLPFNGCVYP